MKKKNSITFWRIIFTMCVAIFHLGHVYGNWLLNDYGANGCGWYISVEFFFLVSGYLLVQEYKKGRFKSPYAYTFHRLIRLYPQYIFAFLVNFTVWILVYDLKEGGG